MNSASIRRFLPTLALLLFTTAATRLGWLAFVHPDPNDGRWDDTVWYRLSGSMIALGHGYSNPYTGTPTAAWPPGYPAFLGGVFKAFGEGITQTYVANLVLAMITVLIVYVIGLLLFDRATATIGAGALAIWPGQVFFVSLTLSEILFTALFSLGLLVILLAWKFPRSRPVLVILLGVVIAAAALTRGQALLLLALAPLAWWLGGVHWRRAIGWGMLAAVVTAVLIAPWVARNVRELHSPVIIATNVGGDLWLGSHAGASGRMNTDQPLPLPSRVGLTQTEYEVKGDQMARHAALEYISHHPLDELRLSGVKLRAMYEADSTALDWNSRYSDSFYAGDSDGWLRGIANGFWFAALGVAGIGLIADRARLRGIVAILPATLLLWTVVHLVFFGDPRFHYPVVFIVALLAARGLVAMRALVSRRQPSFRRGYAPA